MLVYLNVFILFCSIFKDHFLSQLSLLLFVFFCHPQATRLVYHLIQTLSTTFSKLSKFFLKKIKKVCLSIAIALDNVFYLNIILDSILIIFSNLKHLFFIYSKILLNTILFLLWYTPISIFYFYIIIVK